MQWRSSSGHCADDSTDVDRLFVLLSFPLSVYREFIIRYLVNMPYIDTTGQQSAGPSVPQPTMTQQTPNWMSQQVQQMQSAGQPMMHTPQQLAMMANTANMASPQQMPAVDQQVDWNAKIAEVMREQFG